ncbi:MAG: ribosome recycling factor [Chitinophagales bacterium]|nr:ribosome recycling factor [Bacteroidota bacterium]MCB9256328.1 ribosome recycling factor [Chitinophagales bacterium]
MQEELEMMLAELSDSMDKAIEHLQKDLLKIRAGKASPSMLSGVLVEAYGVQSPINQLANINTPDARTISIQPFDKSTLQSIEKGILQANIGLTPQNDGEFIRLNIPPLTEERRKEMVKQTKAEGEHAKISLRSARKEAMDYIKSLEKEGLSEDMAKTAEEDVQKVVNDYTAKVEKVLSVKEAEIMTV